MLARLRPLLVLLAVLATITVNGLANALPINGQQTGEISDRFDVLFVPAGYVFSIWGLIYLGLIAFAIYQLLPAQRDNERVRAIDGPVILGCVANGAWIFAWHHERFVLSLVLMVTLLGALIATYLRLAATRAQRSTTQRWLVDLPFSVYLGWITVACIANATVVLRHVGWGGFGLSDLTWLIVMLGVALLLAGAIAWTQRDAPYLAVLVWAFVGIAVAQAGGAQIAAAVAAGLATGLLLVAALAPQRQPAR